MAFANVTDVVGFDIDASRIDQLKQGFDKTMEVTAQELAQASRLSVTANLSDLSSCNVFIITVPTPLDEFKRPDLRPLRGASSTVGSVLEQGDVVIYESTVYPGATEEECVPILEASAKLKFNKDFAVGYSPERVNPGDKSHRLTAILKVTSGSTTEAAEFIMAVKR